MKKSYINRHCLETISVLYIKLHQHYEKRSMKEGSFANMRFVMFERAKF